MFGRVTHTLDAASRWVRSFVYIITSFTFCNITISCSLIPKENIHCSITSEALTCNKRLRLRVKYDFVFCRKRFYPAWRWPTWRRGTRLSWKRRGLKSWRLQVDTQDLQSSLITRNQSFQNTMNFRCTGHRIIRKWRYANLGFYWPPPSPPLSRYYSICLMWLCHKITTPCACLLFALHCLGMIPYLANLKQRNHTLIFALGLSLNDIKLIYLLLVIATVTLFRNDPLLTFKWGHINLPYVGSCTWIYSVLWIRSTVPARLKQVVNLSCYLWKTGHCVRF